MLHYVSDALSDSSSDEEEDEVEIRSEDNNIRWFSEDEFDEEAITTQEWLEDRMVDQIYVFDSMFVHEPLRLYQTMIGSWFLFQNHARFASAISSAAFFHFPFQDVVRYLRATGVSSTVDIIQIEHVHSRTARYGLRGHHSNLLFTPTVIIKTHWLRLVQRTWKRIFRERQQMIMKRMHPNAQRYAQIHGTYPPSMRILPSYKGNLRFPLKPSLPVKSYTSI